MQSERVVVITDIHGCLDECKELLDRLSFDKTKDMLINLGDTIDRGHQIYELFEFLHGLKEEMGDRFVLIRGNHEQMMINYYESNGTRDIWLWNGGDVTRRALMKQSDEVQKQCLDFEPTSQLPCNKSITTTIAKLRRFTQTA